MSIRLLERLTIEGLMDELGDRNVSATVQGMSMKTTLQAARHLCQNSDKDLRVSKIISGVH